MNVNDMINLANSMNTIVTRSYYNTDGAILDELNKKHGYNGNSIARLQEHIQLHELFYYGEQEAGGEGEDDCRYCHICGNRKFSCHCGWRLAEYSPNNYLIVYWTGCIIQATTDKVRLSEIDPESWCVVEDLKCPKLSIMGDLQKTDVITAEISFKKGDPELVNWYPGEYIPQPTPHVCSVGDIITAKNAMLLGWTAATITEYAR